MVSLKYSGKVGTEPEELSPAGDRQRETQNNTAGKGANKGSTHCSLTGSGVRSGFPGGGQGRVRHTAVKRMSDWKESHSNRE